MTALGVLAAFFLACEEDTTPASALDFDGGPGIDIDGSTSGLPDAATSDAADATTDGASTLPRTGRFLRFTHLAHARQADQIDFCLEQPSGSGTFVAVYGPMGAPGLHYGEVGRYIPIDPGEHELRMTTTGDCEDWFDDGSVNIPPSLTYVRATFALTLTSTGVISVGSADADQLRDPTQDRVTVVDGTGPRGSGEALSVSWVGPSTVDLAVQNHLRSSSTLLPAGQTGSLTVSIGDGQTQRPLKTVAGGHAMAVVYGAGLVRVCDYDTPDPTTGALASCNDRN